VVRLYLKEGEGGVNIKMSQATIEKLSKEYGKPAADAFVRRFAADGSKGWLEHRWVRFNRLLIALREQIDGVSVAIDFDRYTHPPLREQLAKSVEAPPLEGPLDPDENMASEKKLDKAQVCELRRLLEALVTLESSFAMAGEHEPYVAEPRPSLRVRHPT
jgi:hypothetical protein